MDRQVRTRGRPEGAKGKPLERKNFVLARLALQLGRVVTGDSASERLSLAHVAKWIGLKDRASYHWSKGRACQHDGEDASTQPFIPPTSFDAARDMLVNHAVEFIGNFEAENRRWLEERKKQLKAAKQIVSLFGPK